MRIHKWGNREYPKNILLAPVLVSGEKLYQFIKPYLKGEYCIISPDQGGHGLAGTYTSAHMEYQELKKYLLEENCIKIKLLYGAFLSAAVGYQLFNDSDFEVEKAWFDGAMLIKQANFAE